MVRKNNSGNHGWLTVSVASILLLLQTSNTFAQKLFFERVFDESLAQASYLVGDMETREVIVIDPKRDIDTYLEIAKKNNLNITRVTETHIHADFLSGSRELVAATGAELLLSAEGGDDWQYEFSHTPLRAGSVINVGKIKLDVLHTPGHTPESITFLLTDPSVSDTPQKALTGDFIFVGDVGRPDLLEKAAGQEDTQEESAKQLYTAIQNFLSLPDELEIWPGHGAGSFCGKTLSNIPHTTLKDEKLLNGAFQFKGDQAGFVKYILEDQPEPPSYFAVMKQLNKEDRPLLIEVPQHPKLLKEAFQQAQQNNLLIVDARNKDKVAAGYIPGSLHIEGNKTFSTQMGSLVDYRQQLVLVADNGKIEDLTRKLMRIGMDNIYGYIEDVNSIGKPLDRTSRVDIDTFKSLKDQHNVQVVDVRMTGEFAAGHIAGADNVPLASLAENLDKISKDKKVIVHCQSGVRAAAAHSILRNHGFDNITVYSGGMNEWNEQENEVVK